MEATAATRAAEKKKKRSVVLVGEYVLKRMGRSPRVNLVRDAVARLEVEIAPTVSQGTILFGVLLVEVTRGSSSRQSPLRSRGSIRLSLLGTESDQPYFWETSRGSRGYPF